MYFEFKNEKPCPKIAPVLCRRQLERAKKEKERDRSAGGGKAISVSSSCCNATQERGGGYVVIGRKRLIVTESHTSIFQTGGRKKSRRERNGKTGRNEKIGREREERGLPLPVDNQAERGKKHNLQSATTTM